MHWAAETDILAFKYDLKHRLWEFSKFRAVYHGESEQQAYKTDLMNKCTQTKKRFVTNRDSDA